MNALKSKSYVQLLPNVQYSAPMFNTVLLGTYWDLYDSVVGIFVIEMSLYNELIAMGPTLYQFHNKCTITVEHCDYNNRAYHLKMVGELHIMRLENQGELLNLLLCIYHY